MATIASSHATAWHSPCRMATQRTANSRTRVRRAETCPFFTSSRPALGPTHLRGSADKSLTRPGRKQATATKLWIYSTHSTRSSVHFLALCCNLCKPLKKQFRTLSVQPGLRGNNDLRAGRKMATFQLSFFFSPWNRW